MRTPLALLVVTAGVGCSVGCNHDRVLLSLSGEAAGATELEIVMAEPFTTNRLQRIEVDPRSLPPGERVEQVFYIAQRAAVRFAVDPATPIAGTELQIEQPSRERFLPIAIARDATGTIVAMGAYRADQIFVADGITPAAEFLADVTFYDLVLEPVRPRTDEELGVPPGTALVVDCDGVTSGIAWRRGKATEPAKPQLRIVKPLDDPDGTAIDRLDNAVDLDCDGHSPGIGGVARGSEGDRQDCNDIDTAIAPDMDEVCDGRDNNCDDQLGGLGAIPASESTCPPVPQGCPPVHVCDESRDGQICGMFQGCPVGADVLECRIPFQVNGDRVKPCDEARGRFAAVQNPCPNGCRVTLVEIDPRWAIQIGDVQNPLSGIFEPYDLQPQEQLGIRASTSIDFDAMVPDAGSFTVLVEPIGLPAIFANFGLDLTQNNPVNGCDSGVLFTCGPRG